MILASVSEVPGVTFVEKVGTTPGTVTLGAAPTQEEMAQAFMANQRRQVTLQTVSTVAVCVLATTAVLGTIFACFGRKS